MLHLSVFDWKVLLYKLYFFHKIWFSLDVKYHQNTSKSPLWGDGTELGPKIACVAAQFSSAVSQFWLNFSSHYSIAGPF